MKTILIERNQPWSFQQGFALKSLKPFSETAFICSRDSHLNPLPFATKDNLILTLLRQS